MVDVRTVLECMNASDTYIKKPQNLDLAPPGPLSDLEATDKPPFTLGLCRSFGLSNGDEALRILHQNCLANHKGYLTTVDRKATWGTDTVKPWFAQSQ